MYKNLPVVCRSRCILDVHVRVCSSLPGRGRPGYDQPSAYINAYSFIKTQQRRTTQNPRCCVRQYGIELFVGGFDGGLGFQCFNSRLVFLGVVVALLLKVGKNVGYCINIFGYFAVHLTQVFFQELVV